MLMKIVEIPEDVRQLFDPFREVFSRPQFKHFVRLVLGLILPSSKNKTIQAISQRYCQGTDRSCLTRFLERSPWSVEAAVNKALKLMYRRLPRPKGGLLYLIIDDSETEKTGKKIAGAGWYHDSLGKQRYIFGHSFVMAMVKVGKICFPVGVRLYLKEEYCLSHGIKFKTKNELAVELIKSFVAPAAGLVVVVFDSWYLNNVVVSAAEGRGFSWVSRVKSNRVCEINGERYVVSEYADALGGSELSDSGFVPRSHTVSVIGHGISGSLRRIGDVLLAFGCNERGNWHIFATDLEGWEICQVFSAYDVRWSIECCFRESKQHLGLGECQCRLLRCVVIHLHMVIIAWILLAAIQLKAGFSELTIGDLCRWVAKEVERCQIRYIQRRSSTKGERDSVESLLLAE